jgi:DNA invertase Pin-like site-specific DNA recombinase
VLALERRDGRWAWRHQSDSGSPRLRRRTQCRRTRCWCIAKAKAEGKYKGRKPTARAKSREVLELRSKGVKATAIAEELGIGRASVYRILADAA